jgi:hypothetical protein
VVSAATACAQQVKVQVDGERVHFQGQGPMMRGHRVLVPLRGVLEQMGAYVGWDPDTQTVTARSNDTNVRLRIGMRSASVNGQRVALDVPAMIVNGSTMVPLRFVGEALGNTVQWDEQGETVEITTGSSGAASVADSQGNRAERLRGDSAVPTVMLSAGTVLPVTLDQSLSSSKNAHGDRFTATLSKDSAGLLAGTKVEGFVEAARPRSGNKPGMLELKFDRLDLANGDSYPLHGSLIGLDDKSVFERDGRMVARRSDVNRGAYTGVGAGAGLVVGLIGHRPLEDTAIGALLGFGAAALQGQQVHNVILDPGTEFGVRLNSDVSIKGR